MNIRALAVATLACGVMAAPAAANPDTERSSVNCSAATLGWTGYSSTSTRTREYRVLVDGVEVVFGRHTWTGSTAQVVVPLTLAGVHMVEALVRVGWSGPWSVAARASVDCSPPPVPPTAPEPPADNPPGPPAEPPTYGTPPTPPKVRDCTALRTAGIKWRIKFGCAVPRRKTCPVPYLRRTQILLTVTADGRRVLRRVVTCVPPRRHAPPVTG